MPANTPSLLIVLLRHHVQSSVSGSSNPMTLERVADLLDLPMAVTCAHAVKLEQRGLVRLAPRLSLTLVGLAVARAVEQHSLEAGAKAA